MSKHSISVIAIMLITAQTALYTMNQITVAPDNYDRFLKECENYKGWANTTYENETNTLKIHDVSAEQVYKLLNKYSETCNLEINFTPITRFTPTTLSYPQIQSIKFSNVFDKNFMQHLYLQCPNLNSLEFCKIPGFNNEPFDHLCRACPQLKRLSLFNLDFFNDPIYDDFITNLDSLQHLDLDFFEICTKNHICNLEIIATQSHLKEFCLAGPINHETLQYICNHCSLLNIIYIRTKIAQNTLPDIERYIRSKFSTVNIRISDSEDTDVKWIVIQAENRSI
jgi:hypothetical protein